MKTRNKTEYKIWIKYYVNGVLNETVTFFESRKLIESKKVEFLDKGLVSGDRVVVNMNNSIDAIINYLSLSELGIISVPVNPSDSKIRLDFIIQDCNPRAIIDNDNNVKFFKINNNNKTITDKKINTIIYTSGTTGKPKGVCLSLDNWKSNSNSLIKHHQLDDKTKIATPLPIFHCNAHGLGMYATYYSKSTLILFDNVPKNFLDIINKEKVNIVSIVPSILRKIFENTPNFKPHNNFGYFLTAAAPLSGDLLNSVLKKWGTKIIQGYGLSESTNFSCTLPINLSDDMYKEIMLPNPSIGIELDNVEVKLSKKDSQRNGELIIKSPSNSLGYWKNNLSNRDEIKTGDIGYYKIIKNKKFFYLKGRKKEIINRGGEKIYPLELESEINKLGINQEFNVIPISDRYLGEDVGLVVIDSFDFCLLNAIPYFKRPKKVFKIKEIPKTSTGKIQRTKIAKMCDSNKIKLIWKYEKTKKEIKFLVDNFNSFLNEEIYCVGRIYSIRKMKDYIFADIYDKDSLVQIRLNKSEFNEKLFAGDFIKIYGVCEYTIKKQKTINVKKITILNRWKSSTPFKNIKDYKYHPLKSFLPEKYKKVYLSNLIRNNIRKFFHQNDFIEVQTPILLSKYNGGRSFPVVSSYLNERIGFNRTTMEERMQSLIGSGFEKIFQIGSVFRSGEEKTFLEGYTSRLNFNSGKNIIKDMLSYSVLGLIEQGLDKNNPTAISLIKKDWIEIDFFDSVEKYLNLKKEKIKNFNPELIHLLIKNKIISKENINPESLADDIANLVFNKVNRPVIITGFPVWSSPLYKKESNKYKLKRCRVYIPGQNGGFEIGVQENDIDVFRCNIEKQKKEWNLSEKDDRVASSELEEIISAGLPEILGFALSPDRILKIWIDDASIDSYE